MRFLPSHCDTAKKLNQYNKNICRINHKDGEQYNICRIETNQLPVVILEIKMGNPAVTEDIQKTLYL